MKRASIVAVWLALGCLALAQQQAPTAQSQPGAQNQQGAAAPTAPAAAPQGKRPPQAKTQAEFDAFNAAKAGATDAASWEKAADDFAGKFPDSELRILLYEVALGAYQQSNNGEKMAAMGRKVLSLDPDQPDALIGVAEVLVERTRETDLDKDQRYDEASKNSQRALETIETDIAVPAGTPQEKVDAYKATLRSSAYSILGTVQFNKGNYSEAESYFHKSIDAYPAQPDPVVILRLALALDKQGKYVDALQHANRAVELTQEGTTVGTFSRRERDRLVQLTGGVITPSKPAAGTQNPGPPKN